MKAAILDTFGHPPHYGDFPEPRPQVGETLVDVTAAAIKQLDRAIAAGTHYSAPKTLPFICGTDGVGRLSNGQGVYFAVSRRPFGGMAERAPAEWVVPLPEDLDPSLAAAIVNPALAAWLPLAWRARLAPGETVVILGATGASGRLAVKAARLLGAGRVIAAGRNADVLRSLDADETVDLRLSAQELRDVFARHATDGIGVVVDYVWGPPAEALIGALVRGDLHASDGVASTRFVTLGAMAGATIPIASSALRGARLEIMGSGTGNYPPLPILRRFVSDMLFKAAAGAITIDLAVEPLSDVANIWSRLEKTPQRIVVTPDS